MLAKILLPSLRRLARNKTFSFINVLGLSAGLTAFILIILYVRFELSFDKFHKDADNIYRVVTKVTLQNEIINHESNTYDGIIKSLREDYQAVDDLTVISAFDADGTLMRFADPQGRVLSLTDYKGLYGDESFFSVLSFPLTKGDPASSLKTPYSVVISRTLSSKYFGEDPIGRTIEFIDDDKAPKLLTITGVMENVPANSHLKFDLVINLPEERLTFWDWRGHAYLKFKHPAETTNVERRLNALATEKNGLKINRDDYGQVSTFNLQPLKDIHLYSKLEYEFERGSDSLLVYSLLTFGFLILAIAWVNYINLYSAIVLQKIRQFGIRKIIGGSKTSLILQILMDALLYHLISLAIALLSVWVLLPAMSNGTGVPAGAIKLMDPVLWLTAVVFMFLSVIVSGGYPSMIVAVLDPLKALKGHRTRKNGLTARRELVAFQFAIATLLITTTLVVNSQLRFMQDQDLGIKINEVLAIKAMNFHQETWSDSAGRYVVDKTYQQKVQLFANELSSLESITNITSLSHLPGQVPDWGTEFKVKGEDPSKAYNLKAIGVDYDFIPTLGISLLAGRNFSRDFPSDQGNENRRAIVINEAASELLGFRTPQEAISQHIETYWGADNEIVGVVNSFHQVSLKEKLTPLYFILQPRALSYFAINFKSADLSQTISDIRTVWTRHFPEYPFDYFFLDEYFNHQYASETKFARATTFFTILAIVIGCMGIFGLTSFAIVQRSKEIGIRKVLGASAVNVITLFSTDFINVLLFASCIAIPATCFGIVKWLDHYAYRISLEWWMLGAPLLIIMGIALLTISLQTIKVAFSNPVESLRHE